MNTFAGLAPLVARAAGGASGTNVAAADPTGLGRA
jgi:hypothetical protein